MPIRVYSPTEHHEMQFIDTLESGAQHWQCPQCGRRMSMQVDESDKRVTVEILAKGNDGVGHSGRLTGGLTIGQVQVHVGPTPQITKNDLDKVPHILH